MDRSSPDRTEVTHLAILVVYALGRPDDIRLLELHLDRIARHTRVPYTIFAVAPRLAPDPLQRVLDAPNVVMCDIPPTERRSSREHGYYLDAMVPLALDSGVSHLCTLDVDSFPVRDDWLEVLGAAAPPESGLVGVLREENGDTALPHPSCIFAPREFYERHHPSFWPEREDTPEFREFLETTGQAPDTGIRLAALLWNERLPWGKLRRTNAVDLHYLLAGIYGDTIFHFGGITRGKVFRRDLANSRVQRLTQPLAGLRTRGTRTTAAKRWLVARLRRRAHARLAAHNRGIYFDLRERLLSDPDGFLAYLRGAPQPEVVS